MSLLRSSSLDKSLNSYALTILEIVGLPSNTARVNELENKDVNEITAMETTV